MSDHRPFRCRIRRVQCAEEEDAEAIRDFPLDYLRNKLSLGFALWYMFILTVRVHGITSRRCLGHGPRYADDRSPVQEEQAEICVARRSRTTQALDD
jgi:hypothetical protein